MIDNTVSTASARRRASGACGQHLALALAKADAVAVALAVAAQHNGVAVLEELAGLAITDVNLLGALPGQLNHGAIALGLLLRVRRGGREEKGE